MNEKFPLSEAMMGSGGVPTPASVFQRSTPPAPEKPTPDGRLIIRTIFGQEHSYEFASMPKGWRPVGSGIQVTTPTGRITWVWRQILSYEVIGNSTEFQVKHRRWHAYQTAEAAKKAEEETCVGADGD